MLPYIGSYLPPTQGNSEQLIGDAFVSACLRVNSQWRSYLPGRVEQGQCQSNTLKYKVDDKQS